MAFSHPFVPSTLLDANEVKAVALSHLPEFQFYSSNSSTGHLAKIKHAVELLTISRAPIPIFLSLATILSLEFFGKASLCQDLQTTLVRSQIVPPPNDTNALTGTSWRDCFRTQVAIFVQNLYLSQSQKTVTAQTVVKKLTNIAESSLWNGRNLAPYSLLEIIISLIKDQEFYTKLDDYYPAKLRSQKILAEYHRTQSPLTLAPLREISILELILHIYKLLNSQEELEQQLFLNNSDLWICCDAYNLSMQAEVPKGLAKPIKQG